MAEALRIGIAGLGTVGASVVRVLSEKAAELTRQCGRELVVTGVSARDREPRPRRRSRHGANGSTIRSSLPGAPASTSSSS